MAEEKKVPQGNQLNIELTEEVAEGTYSNLAIITHSPSEFVVDFIRVMPGVPKAKVKSRVVLTPFHAKRLLKALADNVSKYEAQFGKIEEGDANVAPTSSGTAGAGFPPISFGGTPTEA
jgi:hypothetical protein